MIGTTRVRLTLLAFLALLSATGILLTFSSASAPAGPIITIPTPTASISAMPTPPTKSLPSNFSDSCGFTLINSAPVTSVKECTVLVVGDSMASNLGWGLSNILTKTSGIHLILKGKPSTGLANSWFYDWTKELPPILAANNPDLVIVFIGANDYQSERINSIVEPFAGKAWLKNYTQQITAIEDEAKAAGAFVVWVELPVMRPPGYAIGINELTKIQKRVVDANQEAIYLSIRSLISNQSGEYSENAIVNGQMTKIRGDDGIHFSSIGQRALATYVVENLNHIFHVEIPLPVKYQISR